MFSAEHASYSVQAVMEEGRRGGGGNRLNFPMSLIQPLNSWEPCSIYLLCIKESLLSVRMKASI